MSRKKPLKNADARTKAKARDDAVDFKLIKAFGHPLRTRILSVLNEKVSSPSDLAVELESTTGHTAYHVKILKEIGFVELVKTAQRRGATEHYYRATRRALIPPDAWERLPAPAQQNIATDTFQLIIDDASAAVEANAYSNRPDSHASWTPMTLDEDGWTEFTELLDETLNQAIEIQSRAMSRMAEGQGQPVQVSMALAGYESARRKD